MNVIPLEKTSLTLPEAAALAKNGSVILTRNGEPLAAIRNLTGADGNPWRSPTMPGSERSSKNRGALIVRKVQLAWRRCVASSG